MKKPLYYRLPAAAIENQSLSRAALCVLAVIIDATEYSPGCELLLRDIAAAAGCCDRTARQAITDLIAAELLTVRRTGRGSIYTPARILPELRRSSRARSPQGSGSIPPETLDKIMGGI